MMKFEENWFKNTFFKVTLKEKIHEGTINISLGDGEISLMELCPIISVAWRPKTIFPRILSEESIMSALAPDALNSGREKE